MSEAFSDDQRSLTKCNPNVLKLDFLSFTCTYYTSKNPGGAVLSHVPSGAVASPFIWLLCCYVIQTPLNNQLFQSLCFCLVASFIEIIALGCKCFGSKICFMPCSGVSVSIWCELTVCVESAAASEMFSVNLSGTNVGSHCSSLCWEVSAVTRRNKRPLGNKKLLLLFMFAYNCYQGIW